MFAIVMGMEDKIGNFVVGKEFDAIIVDLASPGMSLLCFGLAIIY